MGNVKAGVGAGGLGGATVIPFTGLHLFFSTFSFLIFGNFCHKIYEDSAPAPGSLHLLPLTPSFPKASVCYMETAFY